MEFTVAGSYWDTDAVITWKDGKLTGTPETIVNRIKALDKLDFMQLGSEPFLFDLERYEVAYMFLAEYYVDEPIVSGDKPEYIPNRIY